MVGLNLQVRSQELFAGGFGASAWRLYGHKNHVHTGQGLRIAAPQYPSLVTVILIEEAKARWLLIAAASPGLERNRLFEARLLLKIESIEHL